MRRTHICVGTRGLFAVADCDKCSPSIGTSGTGCQKFSGFVCPAGHAFVLKLGMAFWGWASCRGVCWGSVSRVSIERTVRFLQESVGPNRSRPDGEECFLRE